MARVEILAHYMDDTLRRLGALLGERGRKKLGERGTALAPVWRNGCQCGLNPLLDYYLAGEEALAIVLAGLSGEDEKRINHCWHRLAQEEIGNLCGACCRRAPSCPLGAAAVES